MTNLEKEKEREWGVLSGYFLGDLSLRDEASLYMHENLLDREDIGELILAHGYYKLFHHTVEVLNWWGSLGNGFSYKVEVKERGETDRKTEIHLQHREEDLNIYLQVQTWLSGEDWTTALYIYMYSGKYMYSSDARITFSTKTSSSLDLIVTKESGENKLWDEKTIACLRRFYSYLLQGELGNELLFLRERVLSILDTYDNEQSEKREVFSIPEEYLCPAISDLVECLGDMPEHLVDLIVCLKTLGPDCHWSNTRDSTKYGQRHIISIQGGFEANLVIQKAKEGKISMSFEFGECFKAYYGPNGWIVKKSEGSDLSGPIYGFLDHMDDNSLFDLKEGILDNFGVQGYC